jgi:hypothetical protein
LSLLEIAEEHGFRIWIATGRCLLGAARVELGRTDEGLADIRSGMALYQDLRSPPIFWPFLLYIGSAALHSAGRSKEGMAQLEVAIGLLSEPPPGASMLPELLLLKGDILRADGDGDAAHLSEVRSLYERAYSMAAGLDARSTQLRAATRLARIAGDSPAAMETLAATYATFDEGFETLNLREAAEVLSTSRST